MKKCSRCKLDKDESEFNKNSSKKDGLNQYCKYCDKEYSREYRQANYHRIRQSQIKYDLENKDKRREYRQANVCKRREYQKEYNLKNNYNLSIEEHNTLLIAANNKCQICGKEFNDKNKPHVDHNHITGKIRGVLCANCNRGIGLLKADYSITLLNDAIKYIETT